VDRRKKKAHKFKVDLKKEARDREENIMKMVRERKANKVVEELQFFRQKSG
jgi:phosphoribosylformylglycinamidine (FGAM) synthase PurS component